jgi:hypothetical protein
MHLHFLLSEFIIEIVVIWTHYDLERFAELRSKRMTEVNTSCAAERKGWNGSSWIRKEKRLAIYLRDGFECNYCGTDLHDAKPEDINLDHITPRCEGGSNHESNLITACKKCNSGRGAKPVKQYATAGALDRIKRHTRRSLARHMVLARAIIADRTRSKVEGVR